MSEKILQVAWWGVEVGRPIGGGAVASFPAWNKEVAVRIQPGGKFWSERAGTRLCGVEVGGEKGVHTDWGLRLGDRARSFG